MEPDKSFDNFVLASHGGFRAHQLTGWDNRVKSTPSSAGCFGMKSDALRKA